MLVISPDVVGKAMAGGGIRSYEFARALAPHADVVLAGLGSADASELDVPVVAYDPASPAALREHIESADVVVGQPQWPTVAGWLRGSCALVVVDLYVPELFEVLAGWAGRQGAGRRLVATLVVDRLGEALRVGHRFLCATDRQRDLWLGAMAGEGVLGRRTGGAWLDELMVKVPFGAPDALATRAPGGRIAQRFPGVAGGDVVLWNGGLWSWLDPRTAILAVDRLRRRLPDVKLVFMGAAGHRHAARATAEAQALARELGLDGRAVFFNDAWVPYEERVNWLLDADCAVSAHLDHVETRFAFRTRLLDCFWAGLPVVCTEGDDLAERVARDDLGGTVAAGDVDGMAAALGRVLERGRAPYAPRLAAAARDYAWDNVTAPLVDVVMSDARPPRLGEGVPGHRAAAGRAAAYRAARATLNKLGLSGWPGGRAT